MNLSGLLSLLRAHPAFSSLLDQHASTPQSLLEARGPFVVAALSQDLERPILVLTARPEDAQRWIDRLHFFLPSPDEEGQRVGDPPPLVVNCAAPDALPFERIRWTDRTRQQRLTALAALQGKSQRQTIVVASAPAFLQGTLPPRELRMALRPLSVGSFVRLEEMIERWVQSGYEPTEVVEEPGFFARRGGIIDLWPPNLPHPVRIDLFGDEVDSLRIFDPATQRTEKTVDRVEIGPGSEVLSKFGPKILERLQEQSAGTSLASPLDDPHLLLAIRQEIRQETDALALGHSFRGIEWYLPYAYGSPASLIDHLPDDGLLVIDDGLSLANEMQSIAEGAAKLREELVRSGELPDGFASSFHDPAELIKQIGWRNPLLLGFGDLTGQATGANTPLARAFIPGATFGGETKRILRELEKQVGEGHATILVTRQAARMEAEITEAQLPISLQPDLEHPPTRGITLLQGIMADGFTLRGIPAASRAAENAAETTVHLFTDSELFGWRKPAARKRRPAQSTVAPELFFSDVQAGDFVVHMEHGIGQYEGLVKLELGSGDARSTREYLQVNYAQSDKLYVPVHQADRLSRYVGAGDSGIPPSITRLGTADWATVKERARKAVEDIAEDLLALYAERELVRGYAYSVDGPWQEEMEAAFPFQETEDQLRAIEDVKQDMEARQPMDRIIIGDVGYGKTEIGIRAAFKAVMDGKQTAVLVPTTVLAQQHFRTFSRRLLHFPVKVEMLSRFRTSAQQAQVLKGLTNGTIDIVIGTHRLLSDDIQFKDLGLLIIDEEQRFGVTHKEKLKLLRTQVDVLTLSATPIPRTLHMSLSGVRNMSTINTPPQERLPVHTVLSEYDQTLVRQAIQRELDRQGQVFFVHNRVRGLETIASRLRHLVPDATVGVAHGQMAERQLEEMMVQFAEGEIDVLVCTTIVENGLDIRRANTMIINRADHFGLAQLYQLRGRVGRGAVRGYCYLLYDRHKPLSFDARRRLEALLESSEELGAGFRIAMRDLEIRGAGELLGAKQHGQIANVGFDLYTRLLTQAINDLKDKKVRFEQAERADGGGETAALPTEKRQPRRALEDAPDLSSVPLPFALDDPMAPPVTLDLPLDAEIPEDYVDGENLRLQLYRRIAGLSDDAEIDAMRQELLDRFGPDKGTNGVPVEIENLFYQIRVKILALRVGVRNIGRRRDQIAIKIETDLSDARRRTLQQRLRLALGQTDEDHIFRPAEGIHVGREAVYIPIDDEEQWRTLLIRGLEALGVELQTSQS